MNQKIQSSDSLVIRAACQNRKGGQKIRNTENRISVAVQFHNNDIWRWRTIKSRNSSLALWSKEFLILLIINDLQFCKRPVCTLHIAHCAMCKSSVADVLRRRNLYRQTGQWTSCSGATSRWTTCGFFMAVLHLDISKHSSTFLSRWMSCSCPTSCSLEAMNILYSGGNTMEHSLSQIPYDLWFFSYATLQTRSD